MEFTVIINNCPEYAKEHKYIIARNDDLQLWFYGAFDDEKEVRHIAKELGDNSIVIINKNY